MDLPAIRNGIRGNEPRPMEGLTPTSAVLVALWDREPPTLILTRRAEAVQHFPGEISFPGGRTEPQDQDLVQTALRETHEEVGIRPARVDVVGPLWDRRVRIDHVVRPFVGLVDPTVELRPDPAEVDAVLEIELARFVEEGVYEGRSIDWEGHAGYVVNYFHFDEGVVWGATGRLITDLLREVEGWEPPGPTRHVDDREDLLDGVF